MKTLKMKVKIILLVLLVFASSCVTQRRCLQKFPPTTNTTTIVRDSIIEILRDTTIYFDIVGETIIDSVFILCPEVPNYVPDTARAETSLAIAKAYWSFPNIELELTQKDTTIERRLENALREIRRLSNTTTTVTIIPEPVKYIPKINQIALWLWIGVLIALGGIGGFKLYKKFL